MLSNTQFSLDHAVTILRAAGEQTRLRLLALLSNGDLTVTELMDILGQSQPRISRHLKLLTEAGLLERYQEGAWAYFRARDHGAGAVLSHELVSHIDPLDPQILKDFERLEELRRKRSEKAQSYFSANAERWDQLRSLHADDHMVEQAMLELVGRTPFQSMLDLGTGTGRVLELFSEFFVTGVGIDTSRDMLAIARSNLDQAGLSRVQTRHGDIYRLPTPENRFNLVTIHQVLHYLDDPLAAIQEAAKALAPGGRLLISDFAPHGLDFLRDEYAHLRLGFSNDQICGWLESVGLDVVETRQIGGSNEKSDKDQLTVSIWLAGDQRLLVA